MKEFENTIIEYLEKYFSKKIKTYIQIAVETHNHKELKQLETLLDSFINYDN